MNFLDSLNLTGKIRKKYSLWVINSGSMSSLNITLSELFNTHVSVYTFNLVITLIFLLLNLSFIHGEYDIVSYMTDKSSCPICKLKYALGHLYVMLTIQGFIPSSDYYLDSIIILSDITCVYLPISSS